MGLRETYGGIIEDQLFELVDQHMDGNKIKEKIKAELDKLIDEAVEKNIDEIKQKIKELIDKIDGEKDLA